MDCSEFLERFSELEDGLTDSGTRQAAEAHLSGCADCRRYRTVFRRGVEMLRTLESPRLRDDFRPRLQHRIYHVEDGPALDRSGTSGATLLVAAGMTALLSFAAWSPAMRTAAGPVEVDAPAVAARPAPQAVETEPRPTAGSAARSVRDEARPTPRGTTRPALAEPRVVRSLLHDYSSFGRADASRSYLHLAGATLD